MDVYTRLKDIQRGVAAVAVLSMGLAGAWAQSPATEAATTLNLPPNPPVVTKFFPLSEIRRGQQGVAYTVFEGTKPEPMGLEMLGVLHNAIGPRQDMILVRLEGTKPEYTGVVAGMSGSPVYIDGQLVGALAFRIGQFSKEPIAGITPIQQMLGVEDQGAEPENEIAGLKSAASDPSDAAAVSAPGSVGTFDKSMMQPMDTPLVFSGFSPAAFAVLERSRASGAGSGGGGGRIGERREAAGSSGTGIGGERGAGARGSGYCGDLHGDVCGSEADAGVRASDYAVWAGIDADDQGGRGGDAGRRRWMRSRSSIRRRRWGRLRRTGSRRFWANLARRRG